MEKDKGKIYTSPSGDSLMKHNGNEWEQFENKIVTDNSKVNTNLLKEVERLEGEKYEQLQVSTVLLKENTRLKEQLAKSLERIEVLQSYIGTA